MVQAPTAEDVARETLARGDADVVLMAAAVADYRPAEPEEGKRPKDDEPWTVTLEPTTDVLRELGARRDERPGPRRLRRRPRRARASSARARSSPTSGST